MIGIPAFLAAGATIAIGVLIDRGLEKVYQRRIGYAKEAYTFFDVNLLRRINNIFVERSMAQSIYETLPFDSERNFCRWAGYLEQSYFKVDIDLKKLRIYFEDGSYLHKTRLLTYSWNEKNYKPIKKEFPKKSQKYYGDLEW